MFTAHRVLFLALFFFLGSVAISLAFRAGILISARKDQPGSVSPQEVLRQAVSNEAYCDGLATLTLINPNPYDLSDYQIELNILSLSDISDPKFVLNGQALSYCFEQSNGECSASPRTDVIWLRVSSIPAGSSVSICVGNGGTASDGSAVFDFYDDFNDGVIDSSKWQQYYDSDYGNGNVEAGGYFYMQHRGAIRSRVSFLARRVVVEAKNIGVQNIRYRSLVTITTNPDLTADPRNSFNVGASAALSASMYTGNSAITEVTWTEGSRIGTYAGDCVDGIYKLILTDSDISFYRDTQEYWGPVGFDGLGQSIYVYLASSGYLGEDTDTSSIKTDWIRVRKYAGQSPGVSWSRN